MPAAHRRWRRRPTPARAPAPTGASRIRSQRGRAACAVSRGPPRTARAERAADLPSRRFPVASRARPSPAAHEKSEQQGYATGHRHGLPGVVAHVAVDIARAGAHLLLERRQPRAQLLQRGLRALLQFGTAGVGRGTQQRLGIVHQRAQILCESAAVVGFAHGLLLESSGVPEALIYAYPHRNRETRAASCATLAAEVLA